MGPWRAMLLFPVRPGAAASAESPLLALAAPAPPLLLFLLLRVRGCRSSDAALAAAGLLLLVLGLAAGGMAGSAIARTFLPGAPRRGPQVHLLFAAWAATIPVLLLFATGSALLAGVAALVWGVVAGTRVLAADAEPGRALVASCAGTGGAILGLLVLGLLVHGRLVMAMPAPGGGTLLVRRGEVPEPRALVLAHDPARATLLLARKDDAGRLVPVADGPRGPVAGLTEVGRVFFFFGAGARLGRPVDGELP